MKAALFNGTGFQYRSSQNHTSFVSNTKLILKVARIYISMEKNIYDKDIIS